MTFKDGISALGKASGNATCHYKYLWIRKKQTPPSYLLHCHAATSVFPLPVGPPIQLHPLSKVPCANHTMPFNQFLFLLRLHRIWVVEFYIWYSTYVLMVFSSVEQMGEKSLLQFGRIEGFRRCFGTGSHQLFQQYLFSTIPW